MAKTVIIFAFILLIVQSKEHQKETSDEGSSGFLTSLRESLVFEGTKWCGLDDIAESYDDLGVNIETDKCCRSHDLSCPIRIKSFQRKYGLSNWSWKTSSHCDCEIRFKSCLLKANTQVSKMVHAIYFNTIKPRCIRLKTLRKRTCVERRWWVCRKFNVKVEHKAYFVPLDKILGVNTTSLI
ncbi:phospholipase A2 isozymes PA3A/PA3B/PA5-like [Rhopilema esculentum]|uniref:phospholipase A2 isozymes PA3A/PA3B/PA5-like n=1 Tax=Rhopilema esculentum TaxID=499914 RepID=UPI0031D2C748